MNKYGDKESPCPIPLEMAKASSVPPLKRIELLAEDTQLMITLISLGEI